MAFRQKKKKANLNENIIHQWVKIILYQEKKKSSYFQFSAQRVPEVTNTRSFSLGYNSSYFKPCYGHEATSSCHGSLCLRTCPGVTAQIKEQKSPSDQLGWGGTSPGEDKGMVIGSLVSCCHVCWQPQPQPSGLHCCEGSPHLESPRKAAGTANWSLQVTSSSSTMVKGRGHILHPSKCLLLLTLLTAGCLAVHPRLPSLAL